MFVVINGISTAYLIKKIIEKTFLLLYEKIFHIVTLFFYNIKKKLTNIFMRKIVSNFAAFKNIVRNRIKVYNLSFK